VGRTHGVLRVVAHVAHGRAHQRLLLRRGAQGSQARGEHDGQFGLGVCPNFREELRKSVSNVTKINMAENSAEAPVAELAAGGEDGGARRRSGRPRAAEPFWKTHAEAPRLWHRVMHAAEKCSIKHARAALLDASAAELADARGSERWSCITPVVRALGARGEKAAQRGEAELLEYIGACLERGLSTDASCPQVRLRWRWCAIHVAAVVPPLSPPRAPRATNACRPLTRTRGWSRPHRLCRWHHRVDPNLELTLGRSR